jgi:hypothetical protein
MVLMPLSKILCAKFENLNAKVEDALGAKFREGPTAWAHKSVRSCK